MAIADDVAEPRKQQIHERAHSDHLRDQVEERNRQRRERRDGADTAAAQAERDEIGHRVLAGITQRFGDEKQNGEIRDKPADRVHEAVEAIKRDQAR